MVSRFVYLLLFSSILFGAGEASFLSLKIHYPNDKNTVTLNANNDIDERLEVFVSLIDKNGNLATKTSSGGTLVNIDNDAITSSVGAAKKTINDIDRSIGRENTARFIFDYSNVSTSKDKDVITVNVAGLKKAIDVNFDYVKAKGLVVRASTRHLDPKLLQGKEFASIQPDAENNLSIHSKTFTGGTAGVSVPIKVYASTEMQSDEGRLGRETLTEGRFTRSVSLNNSIVVVKALADYDADGIADVLVAQGQGVMQDGIASIDMVITKGLSDNEDNTHKAFDKNVFNGLGVAFIAYMKDDLSISNKGILQKDYLDDPDKFNIQGDHNSTDTVIIRSLQASNIKVGIFDRYASVLRNQWEKPYLNYYVLDDASTSTEQNITLTAVDRYGNPAKPSTTASVSLDFDDTYFEIDKQSRFRDNNDANNTSVYTQIITITPKHPRGTTKVNTIAKEGKDIYTKLKILGTGGVSSANPINAVIYMGRITTDYITNEGYSDSLTDKNITLSGSSNDYDLKVVVSQPEINSTKLQVKVYERYINGAYKSDDSTSKYISSASDRLGDMTGGSIISIKGVKNINIPAYTHSNTSSLDGFTVYLFRQQDDLDNNVVILPRSPSSASTSGRRTTVYPGSAIDFSIYGLASNIGDYVLVEYGDKNTNALIDLVKNTPPTSQSGILSYKVGDFIGHNLSLSVAGYTTTSYVSEFSIYVNGHKIPQSRIVSTANDREITERESYGIFSDIKFEHHYPNSDRNVKQIRIDGFGKENRANGDGSTKTSLLELNDIDGDGKEDTATAFPDTTEPIVYKGKVYANKYYLLFDSDNDLQELDDFGNELKTDGNDTRRLSAYRYDVSGRGDIGANSDDEVYIRFDKRDADSDVVATIQSRDGENTIKFTNIHASSSNDYYTVAPEKTTPQINLVNSEVTIKAVGNNNGEADDFVMTLSHSDKNADIYITQIVEKTENFLDKSVKTITQPLEAYGNYYILRTNKPGYITIKTKGLEVDINGDSKSISGTSTLRFVNFDKAPPLVGDPAVLGNMVEVVIEDESLDYDRTIVEARNSEGKTLKKSIRKDNKYTISSLPKGTYQIYVYAVDVFDNEFRNTFTRTITSDTIIDTPDKITPEQEKEKLVEKDEMTKLANKIIEHKEYPAYGKFISYNLTDLYYKNWIFQSSKGAKTYQLFAVSSSTDAFGLKEFKPDLTKINNSKWWYMIKLDGSIGELDEEGRYGWAVISQDLNTVKKLKAINSDGTLQYVQLPVKATLSGEQIVFVNK